jgi:hypothetical protein
MKLMKLVTAAALCVGVISTTMPPKPAEARHGALIGGLVAGAVIGGTIAAATARPYPPRVYYGPACGYYPYPPCAPVYAPPPPPPPYYYYGRRY